MINKPGYYHNAEFERTVTPGTTTSRHSSRMTVISNQPKPTKNIEKAGFPFFLNDEV